MRHSFHLSNFLGGLMVAHKKKLSSYTYINASTFIMSNARILMQLGLINGYQIDDYSRNKQVKKITVFLKYYTAANTPQITDIKIFSSPSIFWYLELKKVKSMTWNSNHWYYIFSTSQGLLDGNECLKRRIGGLLLYKIR